ASTPITRRSSTCRRRPTGPACSPSSGTSTRFLSGEGNGATMLGMVLKKLARARTVLLAVSFATFALLYGKAQGSARRVLGGTASHADVQREVVKLGLDRPMIVQYWDWLKGVVHGDLGVSFFTGESVTTTLSSRVPVTLTMIVVTLILTVIISVLVGV